MPDGLEVSRWDSVAELVEPHREAMKVAYAGYFDTPFPTDETLRQEWRELLRDPAAEVFLATLDGRPVGTVAIRVTGDEGWIEKLYVHPVAQHRGIGRALHDRALQELLAHGCRRANLWVLEVNEPAIAVYLAWGWTRVANKPYAPFGLPQARFVRDLTGRD